MDAARRCVYFLDVQAELPGGSEGRIHSTARRELEHGEVGIGSRAAAGYGSERTRVGVYKDIVVPVDGESARLINTR